MATVKEINHDSSTTIGDFYSAVTDTDGAITVEPAAALGGSVNGVEMDLDAGTQTVSLAENITTSITQLRYRARYDLDGASNSSLSSQLCAIALRDSGVSHFEFQIRGDGASGFVLRCFYWSDVTGLTQLGSNIAFPSGDVCIEYRAIRETSDGNNDGEVEFFINGASQASLSNVENFNNFGIDEVILTFNSLVAGYTGTWKYDEFILTDVNDASLCGVAFTGQRALVEAIDQEAGTKIYLTSWEDGSLYLYNRALSDLSQTSKVDFGAAGASDLTARSKYLVPYTPLFPDIASFGDYVYAYGRWDDGSVKHLALSTSAGGTGTFGSNLGDATWGSDWVGAFFADDSSTFYAFVNGASRALWRSVNGGST
jgi:hypothetical protein